MILITSGAYIDSSLASEFGYIPPSFLPVQNKRLYEHQVELIKSQLGDESIILSIPQSYSLDKYDKKRLEQLNVDVIRVDENFTLGESISIVLSKYENDKLYILHGDTLFSNLTEELNVCSIGNTDTYHTWSYTDFNYDKVRTGFFSFSSSDFLLKELINNGYDFVKAASNLKEIVLNDWLDFSLTSTYYKSVSKFTTQRVFNNLKIDEYSVTKSSDDIIKMQAEAYWLTHLPDSLKHYAPSVYSMTNNSYTLEYCYNSSLSNILIFSDIDSNTIKNIISKCIDYIKQEKSYKPKHKINTNYLYTQKTLSRLDGYLNLDEEYIINGDNVGTIRNIITELDKYIDKDCYKYNSIMHGDLCFSNILYDSRSKHIKLVDPRGVDDKHNISIYGDWRYDVAKLAHSVVGHYDYIIANRFDYKENSKTDIEFNIDYNDELDYVIEYFNNHFDIKMYYPIMINLFLSMIPLHKDNELRQKAMLANALKLHVCFKNQI